MTREEAIRELIAMKPHIDASMSVMGEVAYDMAIEALKAQLSAKDTTLDDVSTAYENGYLQGKFEALQWIPCSERLPEDNKAVLGYAPKYNNIWAVDRNASGEWVLWVPGVSIQYNEDFNGEIVAWMPLPLPPYKENEA